MAEEGCNRYGQNRHRAGWRQQPVGVERQHGHADTAACTDAALCIGVFANVFGWRFLSVIVHIGKIMRRFMVGDVHVVMRMGRIGCSVLWLLFDCRRAGQLRSRSPALHRQCQCERQQQDCPEEAIHGWRV